MPQELSDLAIHDPHQPHQPRDGDHIRLEQDDAPPATPRTDSRVAIPRVEVQTTADPRSPTARSGSHSNRKSPTDTPSPHPYNTAIARIVVESEYLEHPTQDRDRDRTAGQVNALIQKQRVRVVCRADGGEEAIQQRCRKRLQLAAPIRRHHLHWRSVIECHSCQCALRRSRFATRLSRHSARALGRSRAR